MQWWLSELLHTGFLRQRHGAAEAFIPFRDLLQLQMFGYLLQRLSQSQHAIFPEIKEIQFKNTGGLGC